MPVFRHRIYVKRGFSGIGIRNHARVYVTHPLRIINEGIRAEIHSVDLPVFLRLCNHGRLAEQCHSGEAVNIVYMTRNSRNIAGSIRHLRISEHIDIHRIPVEIQRVAPAFLGVRHDMDITPEEKHLPAAVIPAGIGRKHIVFLPGIGSPAECREISVRLIPESRGLHKNRIREHIDIRDKVEFLYLRVVCPPLAFNNLAVLIPH